MNRLFFLSILLWLFVSCQSKEKQPSRFIPFDTLAIKFEQLYPTRLELPDGSTANRVDDVLLIYFDSVPPLNQIGPKLKSAKFSPYVGDSLAKHVNNSVHTMWARKESGGSMDEDLKNLRNEIGPEAKWITPTYSINSSAEKEYLFVPLPKTLVIKTDLLSDELKNELSRIGLREANRTLTEYTIYELDAAKQYTIYPIATYLHSFPGFNAEGSYYFENLPFIKPVFAYPNDTYWTQQQTQLNLIRVPQSWPREGTNSVKVAIIDQGFNLNSLDLSFTNWGRRMDNAQLPATPHYMADRDHGTAVASILGAKRNNQLGIAGVAGSVSIFPLALVNNTDVEVAEALEAAIAEDVDIVNMSIGSVTWKGSILVPKLELAHASGLLLLAASGNDRLTNTLAMPAAHPRVMAIGGSTGNNHDPLSNYGDTRFNSRVSGISVVAPAVVITVDFNGYQWTMHGTSAACPLVAGVAAMIKSKYPGLTNDQIRKVIEKSATKVGGAYQVVSGFPNGSRYAPMGYGRLDAFKAFELASSETMITQPR